MKKSAIAQIAAVLVLFILLVTVGSTQADPVELLNSASEKTSELSDLDMEMAVQMTITFDSEMTDMLGIAGDMDINMDMNMKTSNIRTSDLMYQADLTFDMGFSDLRQSMDMRTVLADGYCYLDTMGQKIKYPMELEEMTDMLEQNTSAASMTFEGIHITSMEKDMGNTVIAYTADSDELNGLIAETLGLLGGDFDDIVYTINSMSGDVTIGKDGYFTRQNVSMDLVIDMLGVSFPVIADVQISYVNPGQPVEIVLPDPEGYMEVDLSGYGY